MTSTGFMLVIFLLYWLIAFKRLPVYYRRWYEHDRNEYPRTHSVLESQRSAAWTALGLACIWPYYEGGRWIRDSLIRTMTKEERREKEFAEAMRIVTEYKAQQEADERREREEFDRKLKGEE